MFTSVPPPPPQDGIIQDQDCDDNPYAPGCPQSGGQEGQGPPPEVRIGSNSPTSMYKRYMTLVKKSTSWWGSQDQEDCANNPYAPGCQPGQKVRNTSS